MQTLNYIPTASATTENIIEQMNHAEQVREKLFEVVTLQLTTGLENFENPQSYATYRSTGGKPLGTVGKDFEPTQPTFLYDNFLSALIDTNADLSQITYNEFKGGSKIIISAPIGKFAYKNLRGLDDEMEMRISLQTGFDGKTKTSMFLDTFRMVCANGMKAWKTEFETSFKNTKGNIGKINLMGNDVAKAINSQTDYRLFIEGLIKRTITPKEHNEYIKKVTGLDINQYNDLNTRSRNILDKINESVAIEMNDAGQTAWALLNGITRYTNHEVKKTHADTQEYIYVGTGSSMNEDAQKYAYELFLS